MCKKLIYLIYLLVLFTSCEEYYTPKIDTIGGELVVDALITNDVSKNYVRLGKTRAFYSQESLPTVSGAKVELVEINGQVTYGYESGEGYFVFSTIPTPGKNYKLRIINGIDIYESEVVTMPAVPTFDNFYSEHVEKKVYKTDGSGVPVAHNVKGREIYIDAPVTSLLSHYRFAVRSTVEWSYSAPGVGGPPPPIVYGWETFYENSGFNVAGPKKFSEATDYIIKHPLVMLSYNVQDYLNTDTLVLHGWIIIVDQFGTSSGSFDYHEKLNNQLAATGSLFDPIQTQVYGNITCRTNPSKRVYGYFDLNSYRQFRYFINLSLPANLIEFRQIYRYPFIPDTGKTTGVTPYWWE